MSLKIDDISYVYDGAYHDGINDINGNPNYTIPTGIENENAKLSATSLTDTNTALNAGSYDVAANIFTIS